MNKYAKAVSGIMLALIFLASYIFVQRNQELSSCEEVIDDYNETPHAKRFFDYILSNEWRYYVISEIKGDISAVQGFVGEQYDGKRVAVFSNIAGNAHVFSDVNISRDYFTKANKALSESCDFSVELFFGELSHGSCFRLTVSNRGVVEKRVYSSFEPFASPNTCHFYNEINDELFAVYKSNWDILRSTEKEPILEPIN